MNWLLSLIFPPVKRTSYQRALDFLRSERKKQKPAAKHVIFRTWRTAKEIAAAMESQS